MWIRSQNDEYLINTNYFKIEEYAKSPMADIDTRVEDRTITLGTYSTKGKAVKVLDIIQDRLIYDCDFYQMPRDDEVEDDGN